MGCHERSVVILDDPVVPILLEPLDVVVDMEVELLGRSKNRPLVDQRLLGITAEWSQGIAGCRYVMANSAAEPAGPGLQGFVVEQNAAALEGNGIRHGQDPLPVSGPVSSKGTGLRFQGPCG